MDNHSPGLSEDSGAGAIVPNGANGRPESSLSILNSLGRPGGTGALSAGSARQLQESAIMTAVRRQMEALEEKLTLQIQRLQKQSDQSFRDVHISRFDTKLGAMEHNKITLDRKHAELGGSIKGVSEEMGRQIKRVDQMDSRLTEWKISMEDEMRTRLSEIEQNFINLSSSLKLAKGSQDDTLKRYHGRLKELEDGHANHSDHADQFRRHREDTTQNVSMLHERIMDIEAHHRDHALALRDAGPRGFVEDIGPSGSLTVLQAQMEEALEKCNTLLEDNVELRHNAKANEENVNSLRTLVEAKDVDARLKESMELDRRLKDVSSRLNTLEQNHLAHTEHTQQKLDGHQQELQEFTSSVRRLNQQARSNPISPGSAGSGQNMMALYDNGDLDRALDVGNDEELASRVSALIPLLQQLAPKVIHHDKKTTEHGDKIIEQETALRQLQFKLNQIDEIQTASKELSVKGIKSNGSEWAALTARVSWLETEVRRLVDEVEGDPQDEDNDEEEHDEETEDVEHDPRVIINRQRRASATE